MKKIYIIIAGLMLTASVFAQAPEKMSYQAVIRNVSNNLTTNQAVGMQISILQTTTTGTAVYVETQTPITNDNGLVSLEIGTGTVVSGTFNTIDWANDTYFIKTETDPTGGTTYSITGTSQLMSVPYALHAKTAENITGTVNYTETDPVYTASEATNITSTDITNLSNLSGTNTGDQDISGIATNTTAIALNTAKTGITTAQAGEITANTAKVGVTAAQATILGNTSGTNTGDQDISGIATNTTAIALNTAKTGITTAQASEITANTAKVGLTTGQETVLGNTSGTNTGDQDGSETKVTAGTNVTVTGNGTTASPYIISNSSSSPTYSIGDFAQGGIVFWVDATGQHGLVCAKTDQNSSIRWSAGTWGNTQAKGDGIFAGKANTTIIIAAHVAIGDDGATYAARICNELKIIEGGIAYGDWYLPSKEELNQIFLNMNTINTAALLNGGNSLNVTHYYWSSTEYDINNAWKQYFGNANQNAGLGKDYLGFVRAIRAF